MITTTGFSKPGNIFVFVVCGSDEHINTLNFSLRYLKHFSKNEIVVVTDLSRNKIKILHEIIVDVRAPDNLDNHQASIFLKTSLHRILTDDNLYCYLDSDVIALTSKVDTIFDHFQYPITFAPDHCTMAKFSPNAVNCGCVEKHRLLADQLSKLFEMFDLDNKIKDEQLREKGNRLKKEITELQKNPINSAVEFLRYSISGNIYTFKHKYRYNKNEKYWTDINENIIMYDQENVEKRIEKFSGLIWDPSTNRWMTEEGNNIQDSKCHHLREAITQKFGIEISIPDYQHWNGGVFIFNKSSFNFMENWHSKTMSIFNDPYWKTRDQGTLIATNWELGFQNHKLLPKDFNFIADFYNNNFIFNSNASEFLDTTTGIKYYPAFIHVYHHFGEKGWNVWDYIESVLLKK